MAAGRRRESDAAKKAKGTFRPHRRGMTDELQAKSPLAPPDWLNDAERVHFATLATRVADIKLDSSTYTEALAMAAKRLAEIESCEYLIEQHGRILETLNVNGDTMLRANPAVAMRNEAMRHLQSLLAEFGLSPTSIGKTAGEKSSKAGDEPAGFTDL